MVSGRGKEHKTAKKPTTIKRAENQYRRERHTCVCATKDSYSGTKNYYKSVRNGWEKRKKVKQKSVEAHHESANGHESVWKRAGHLT